MKKKIILSSASILLFFIIFSFKTVNTNVLPIGSELPKRDLKLLDVNGNKVSMNEAKKQNGLLVMFTCNTCPYVIKNQQRTNAVCKYALQNNIGVILLNSNENERNDDDSYKAMQDYAKEQGYKWYYVVDKDSEIADDFGANRTPESFLFNKDLKLSYHGAIDDNPGDDKNVSRQHLKEAISQLVNGKEIAVKESRSVGCGIKRKE
ncbi:MAG: thioredoxin family protein [Ginsengibacter sp.]